MAKKNAKAAAAAAPAAPAAPAKKGKKQLTAEEKAAKRAAMKERLANRPEGQRPNSKQIDIIDLGNGSKVLNFGSPVRKVGTLVTSVAVNSKGEVVSTALTLIEGVSPKVKKGHGTLVPKTPGMGRHASADAVAADDENDENDEEDGD